MFMLLCVCTECMCNGLIIVTVILALFILVNNSVFFTKICFSRTCTIRIFQRSTQRSGHRILVIISSVFQVESVNYFACSVNFTNLYIHYHLLDIWSHSISLLCLCAPLPVHYLS